ncbi:hypothetical protein LGN24_35730 [Burkholderia seminalis]|uniref:hypothetical protein n=1 Tax=Burkholderia seminalis TaxID=488731 RepID=UPI001CF5473D|nr:hypothetical protein [Burkholderia seminalis]MCA8306835.1 hypothetical protein [Burkholderia seminalis]MCA8435425.1 hypothetical protein [Burkholderia seminalis]
MSRAPLLPSGHRRGLPFAVPEDWTPEQALAVFELLDELREVICARYLPEMQHLLREQRRQHDPTSTARAPPF